MAQIMWNAFGERFYEAGVDRGVVYIDGSPGVPWNGLRAVKEKTPSNNAVAYYIDGVKFLNLSRDGAYEATIEAYTSPPEFDLCDGSAFIRNGLFATQQMRKPFDFAYRTMIGNDIDGTDYGYKIHLVYNATAVPSEKAYSSIGGSTTTADLTWDISTQPVRVPEVQRLTSHLVIDASKAYDWAVEALEAVIYGDEDNDPRMPTPDEVVSIFEDNSILKITDNGDGTFTAEGPDSVVQSLGGNKWQISWPSVVDIGDNTFQLTSL